MEIVIFLLMAMKRKLVNCEPADRAADCALCIDISLVVSLETDEYLLLILFKLSFQTLTNKEKMFCVQ